MQVLFLMLTIADLPQLKPGQFVPLEVLLQRPEQRELISDLWTCARPQ
jgi:hypothetical protein